MSAPTVETERAAFRAAARDAPPGARVPVEVRLAVGDPFDAFRRARNCDGGDRGGDDSDSGDGSGDQGDGSGAWGDGSEGRVCDSGDLGDAAFLETTGGQSGWGYFGVDPAERLTVGADAVCRETSADAVRRDASTGAAADDGSPARGDSDGSPARAAGGAASPTLAALQGWLDGETLVRGDCEVPYPCGAIGWLSYDVARELESLPESTVDDRGLPRLQVAAFDRLAAWECPTGDGGVELRITACPRVESASASAAASDDAGEAAIDAAYERGRDRALALVDRIRHGDPGVGAPPSDADAATFESECGREAYAERVRAIQESVRAGDTFQANVAQRLSAPAAVHPVAAYDALRRVNPAPYSALLELPAADLVSASPELLLERDGDRVRTEPIAGTRPRGATDEADAALERELRTDEKERAEHAMLVDLERNDLGAVCRYGSVDVTEYRRVDRYAEVMHLVSLVEGRLRPDATLADAIAAAFPGGTITGAPKPRTMALIDEVEATRRGPYTGSIGIFGFDGRATLNIVIRTLVRHADEYHLRVGAGIVHDSVPEREYAETLDKARALVAAVDEALGERTELAVEDGGETA